MFLGIQVCRKVSSKHSFAKTLGLSGPGFLTRAVFFSKSSPLNHVNNLLQTSTADDAAVWTCRLHTVDKPQFN